MTHGPSPRRRPSRDVGDTGTHGGDYHNHPGDRLESDLPPPPDGGWGWVVAFASFMIHIVTDGLTYSFGIFYVEFLDYFQEGKGKTAWIVSILVGVTLCSGPISSSFVNRYGCRPVTIAGALLAGVCLIISVFAPNVLTLYFTIGIGTGLGFGLIYLPAIVSVTMYFEKYRSLATGIAVCGSGFGTFIFAPLTDYLVQNYGWRGSMLIIASIVFNCTIFGALFRPLEHKPSKNIPLSDINHTTSSQQAKLQEKHRSENHLNTDGSNGDSFMQRSHSIGHAITPKPLRNGGTKTTTQDPEYSGMTLSQPALVSSSEHVMKRAGSGALYKKDIFYQGSLMNIPQYRSKPELHAEEVTLMDKYGSLRRENAFSLQSEESISCLPTACSKETKDTLSEMLDFSLFKDPIFIIFILSNFFTSIGFNIPYVYVAAQAEEIGLTKLKASYLLSIIGIANTIGRIILGYLADKSWVNRLMVYNVSLTVCGLATIFSIFCSDFYSMAVYATVFGFSIGAYVGLTSVILVDLLGLDKLTNAFGLLLLFQGIASLIGPPMAGWLYDALGSYNPGFLVSGFTIAISGIMLFAIPPMQRYYARRRRHEMALQNGGAIRF